MDTPSSFIEKIMTFVICMVNVIYMIMKTNRYVETESRFIEKIMTINICMVNGIYMILIM